MGVHTFMDMHARTNRGNIERACETHGIDPSTTALGKLIGVHHSQVSRVLAHKSDPGNRFIAGLLYVFGADKFGELFDFVDGDEDAA